MSLTQTTLTASLETGNVPNAESLARHAMWQVARIGGNELRRRTADLITRQQPIPSELLRWVEQDAASIASGESYLTGVGQYHEPWSFTGVGETEVTSRPASYTGPTHVHSPRRFDQKLPESAFDWPIYRAAMTPQVVVAVSGGNANTFVTRGEADLVEVDWDRYEQGGVIDYAREDLVAKREELATVADPQLRGEMLADMDETIEDWDQLSPGDGMTGTAANLTVRVEAMNDNGETRVGFGQGVGNDDAVEDAVASIREETGDDTYVMNDWSAA